MTFFITGILGAIFSACVCNWAQKKRDHTARYLEVWSMWNDLCMVMVLLFILSALLILVGIDTTF